MTEPCHGAKRRAFQPSAESNVILSITAKPDSREFSVEFKGDKIIIFLRSRAKDNRANIELLKELRRMLKKEVSLVSGGKSRNKKVVIYNATKKDVESALRVA